MDILFDLDGTLVDSAPGVVSSLRAAFEACACLPVVPLNAGLIGPPLRETLSKAAGTHHAELVEELAQAFMAHYDQEGCLQALAYPGVEFWLNAWHAQNHRLFIVTNKRLKPTRTLLGALGFAPLFCGIHTLDESEPPAVSKSDLLRRVIRRHAIRPQSALFLGDSAQDGRAAADLGVPFVFAAYGYGPQPGADIPLLARIRHVHELGSWIVTRDQSSRPDEPTPPRDPT